MPILSFKKRFVQPIGAGTKHHTVRCGKRPFKVGQTLYMQSGPRYAPKRFSIKPVKRVRDITISDQTVIVMNENDPGFIVPNLNLFAQADGFADWDDLRSFFGEMHGQRGPDGRVWFLFTGQLVQWSEAPWELPTTIGRAKGACVHTKRCTRVGKCYWERCRFYKVKFK